MRLAGIEIVGFYPYPPYMAEACKRSGAFWFIPTVNSAHGRILDPCAGEGEIASLSGNLLNFEARGCELFPYRAVKAAARMDRVHAPSVNHIFGEIVRLYLKGRLSLPARVALTISATGLKANHFGNSLISAGVASICSRSSLIARANVMRPNNTS
jgi:hypothetical protein